MSDEDEIDYEADAQACVNHNIKGAISAAIQEYVELEKEKDALDARSKEIAASLTERKTKTLPELLRDYGALSFTDEVTGKVLEQELVVAGSLPKGDPEKRKAIIEYIKSIGCGDIIKTEVVVNFGRDSEDAVKELCEYLEKHEAGYDFEAIETIHASTHGALGREFIRENKEIDREKAGLFVTNIAEPHDPKKPKVKAVRSRSRK